ncbi:MULTISPECIES: radical SAM protein [Blautia]|uniref:4Fe-4S cluster-binding domain-containing protein n=1 Tax=Blautia massiliensis (ex Durand et al. 2017) TaxID=1737424 RepID=A0ABW9X6M1_9FIRM|nr:MULTISPECIES: radical SAM protein [Blautia]MZL73815.1 4Fe-4S cluster-binding domain-containing protein [Blautia massiliensis (ex Durand et al. 2017)]MZL78653.1 4Fe-4S cluster-binding domain-containing protein [Blautia massiliensis (ex Durand et al. 2017)]RYT34023.1 radical SAM protein [Blautia sp. aa_0143]
MKTFSKKICEETKKSKLIVYGTGAVGEIAYYALKSWGREPDFFCDHDPNKRQFFNIDVLQPEELTNIKDVVIIIAFKDFLRSAVRILRQQGISNYYSMLDLIGLDIDKSLLSISAQEFLVRKGNYDELLNHAEDDNWICIQHLELVVTERCTLMCKDCSALIPYYKQASDFDVSQICKSFDKLLKTIDQIAELSILGGEPLLNKELFKLLEYYRSSDKIGAIVIYTNGTILPCDDLIRCLINSNIWIHISDYGVPSSKIEELCALFEEKGIRYFVKKYEKWQSAGGLDKRNHTDETLRWMYSRCFKARCYSFYKDKLYACARGSNGASIGIIPDADYIDYSIDETTKERKEQLSKLISKEYIEACKYCDGMIVGHADVAPAIQVKRSCKDDK